MPIGERMYGVRLSGVDFEDIEESHQLQRLHNQLAWIYQLDRSALLFGGGLRPDQRADAAGIHAVHFSQVYDDLREIVGHDFVDSAAK